MLKVDASLPILLDPEGTGRAYTLLRRGVASPVGRRHLRQACGTNPEPMIFTIYRPETSIAEDGADHVLHVTFAMKGALWRTDAITLDVVLPDTMLADMPGRSATEVIDHPALAGRVVRGARNDKGLLLTLEPETVALRRIAGVTPWRRVLTTMMIVGDEIETVLTRERLRRMARRGGDIPAHSMDTCRSGIDPLTVIVAMSAQLMALSMFALGAGLFLGYEMSFAALEWTLATMAVASLLFAWRAAFEFQISDDAIQMPPWLREGKS
jgi:hypothetical protein